MNKLTMERSHLRNLAIGVLSVVFLAICAFVIVPRALESKNQLTDAQRASLYETGALLRKMDKMCAEAGIDKLQDSYLGPKDDVVCVSYSGGKKIVGYLPGEGQKGVERFIKEHGHPPELNLPVSVVRVTLPDCKPESEICVEIDSAKLHNSLDQQTSK